MGGDVIRIPIHGKDHVEPSLFEAQRESSGSGVEIDGNWSVHVCVGRRLAHNRWMGHESRLDVP